MYRMFGGRLFPVVRTFTKLLFPLVLPQVFDGLVRLLFLGCVTKAAYPLFVARRSPVFVLNYTRFPSEWVYPPVRFGRQGRNLLLIFGGV